MTKKNRDAIMCLTKKKLRKKTHVHTVRIKKRGSDVSKQHKIHKVFFGFLLPTVDVSYPVLYVAAVGSGRWQWVLAGRWQQTANNKSRTKPELK